MFPRNLYIAFRGLDQIKNNYFENGFLVPEKKVLVGNPEAGNDFHVMSPDAGLLVHLAEKSLK